MLFKIGFLGNDAPMYMDIATSYFTFFPFIFAFTIYLAVKKRYKAHFISQAILLTITIILVLVFEIGLRLSGGFWEYAGDNETSNICMFGFLIIHIIIAILSITSWIYLFITSLKLYRANQLDVIKKSSHKKVGKLIFLGLTISSIMGVWIYIYLFVL